MADSFFSTGSVHNQTMEINNSAKILQRSKSYTDYDNRKFGANPIMIINDQFFNFLNLGRFPV